MNELGFNVVIEEGSTGQFELYRLETVENSDYWTSYMTEGEGVPSGAEVHGAHQPAWQ